MSTSQAGSSPTGSPGGKTGASGPNAGFQCKGKVVVVGDFNVGKTCLSHRFITKSYTGVSEPTIGAAFQVRTLTVPPSTQVTLEIWDTAGSERYRSLMPMYYRDAYAAVIAYDITDRRSFEHATTNWLDDFRKANEHSSSDVIVILAGTKFDLANESPDKRQVTKEEAEEFAETEGLVAFETSARSDHNIVDVFQAIAEHVAKVKEAQGGRNNKRDVAGRVSLRPDAGGDDFGERRRRAQSMAAQGKGSKRCSC